jgi:hypothetical protein
MGPGIFENHSGIFSLDKTYYMGPAIFENHSGIFVEQAGILIIIRNLPDKRSFI